MLTKQKLKEKLLATGYFIKNNYLEQYLDLVSSVDNTTAGYFEKHHVLQKQYFQIVNKPIDNSKDNIVTLLYKDHCKAHWLLYYCTTGNLKKANAAAVQYILNVYNELNNINKTKEELNEADFVTMQLYYNSIKEDTDSKYYSDDEIKFLQQNYPKFGSSFCAKKLGRTIGSIHNEITGLGLHRVWSWTNDDELFLKQNYETKGGEFCANALGKSKKDVFKKAMRLGLTRNHTKKVKDSWTEEELSLLKLFYPTEGGNVYKRIPNRSYNACRCMASSLGVKCDHTAPKQWNSLDIDILKANLDKSLDELLILLPNKTKSSIQHYIYNHLKGKQNNGKNDDRRKNKN